MIWRADEDDVVFFLAKHLAVVLETARLLLRLLPLAHELRGFGEHVLVRITERDDLDRRDLNQPADIALAIPSTADQSDASWFSIGDFSATRPERGHGECGHPSLQETAAVDVEAHRTNIVTADHANLKHDSMNSRVGHCWLKPDWQTCRPVHMQSFPRLPRLIAHQFQTRQSRQEF